MNSISRALSLIAILVFGSSSCSAIKDHYEDNQPLIIRVMTYNIGDFSGKTFVNGSEEGQVVLRATLSEQKADIIGLQEDVALFGSDEPKDVIFPMYPYYYRYGNRRYNYKAFASIWPIINIHTAFYEKENITFSHDFFLLGHLYYSGKSILLVSFHLDWSDKYARAVQIEQLIDYASSYETVILMGDTNCYNYVSGYKVDDTSLHEEEWAAFKESGYSMANGGEFGLFETWIDGKPIDNIFVKGGIILNAYNVVKDYMNDHYILVADLMF